MAAALVAAWLVALPARAALFDDDEARKRIEQTNLRVAQVQKQLEDRIAALEAQLKSQGLVELFGQVEQLKSDVARLRGQIEVLNYELEQAQKRQRDLYIDLDSRLRRARRRSRSRRASGELRCACARPLRRRSPAPGPAAAAPPAPVAAPGSAIASGSGAAPDAAAIEQRAYDVALDQFKAGNYAAAIASFNAFVKNYPEEPARAVGASTGSATRSSR